MKKAIILLLILSLIPTVAFAGEVVFSEDMESYSDSAIPVTITIDDNTSKQLDTTDWWMMKGSSGNPLNAGSASVFPTLSVVKNGDNTVLQLTGGSGDYSSYISRRQAARYMGTGLSGMPNEYKIDIDFEKVQTRATLCFQFMIHNSGKNYYVVNIAGEKTGGAPVWTVAKIVDNALAEEMTVHSSNTYSSVTASGGGALSGGGHLSVVSDGNGVITATVTGTRYPSMEYSETLTLVDSNPFEIDAKDTTVGFFVGTTNTNAYFDNIVVSKVESFVDYEPGTVLYHNVSDKDAVNEFEECNVRRISSQSLASETLDVTFNSEGGDETYTAEFDANGNWVNLVHGMPCTGITLPDGFDYSELVILAEAGEETGRTLSIRTSDVHYFPRIKGMLNNNEFEWSSSDENIVTVDAGVVTGLRAGTAAVTAEYKGGSVSYDVTVKGEYDFAEESGKLQEYFEEKKPVFDEINNAIAEKDAARLKNVITNAGDIKIELVLDINLEMLDGKTDAEIDALAENLVNYEAFEFNSLEDYSAFEDAIALELDVIKLEKIEDLAVLEDLLFNNNDLLKLDVENEYFARFMQSCISNLLNMEYDNYSDLKQYFDENIVMTSFAEMISYADIEELCDDSAEVIKYDEKHYKNEKCSAMFKELLEEKDDINTITALKDFIDEYEEPEKSSGSSGSGSSKTGGRKSSSSFAADTAYVQKAETDANSGVSTQQTAVYHDVEKDSWYEEYVLKLAGKKIMNGNNGYIKPMDNITRAEFVKMLVLASNITLTEEDSCNFDDVSTDAWYYRYVSGGYVNSIVLGSGNMFYPDSFVTREEIAVLVDRVVNNLGLNVKSVSRDKLYGDDDKISDWAYAAVARCSSYGIINGYGDNTFAPKGYATRAESAKMLSCLIDIINEASKAAAEN